MLKKLILIITIISCSTLFMLFVIPGFYNNILLNKFCNSIYECAKSDYIKLIEMYPKIGILWGNGNHCDMEVITTYLSDFEHYEFLKNINGNKIKYPFSQNVKPIICVYSDTLKIIDNENEYSYDKINRSFKGYKYDFILEKWEYDYIVNIKNKYTNQKIYIILASDQTYTGLSMLDLRCN